MKLLKKALKGIAIFAGLIIFVWLLYSGAKTFLKIDLSQDYLNVQGIENIVFERNGRHQCYKRSFWGLEEIEYSQVNHSDMSYESDDSIYEISDFIDTDNEIRQSIYSPDKRYILYCEIKYDYKNTGITDDEYCYYRVYEIETGKIITIYQAYRAWYNLFWFD